MLLKFDAKLLSFPYALAASNATLQTSEYDACKTCPQNLFMFEDLKRCTCYTAAAMCNTKHFGAVIS